MKVRNSVSSGTSPVVQWLGRHASIAGGVDSAWEGGGSEGGTKISRASQCSQKKKRNSDFTVEKPVRYHLSKGIKLNL